MSCENCELAKRCDAIQYQADELRATVSAQAAELERLRAFVAKVRDAQAMGFPPCKAGIAIVDALIDLADLDKASKETP